jgi:hypothetical protein
MAEEFLEQAVAAGGDPGLIKEVRTQLNDVVKAIEILEGKWDIMDTKIVALFGRLLENHAGVCPVEPQNPRVLL